MSQAKNRDNLKRRRSFREPKPRFLIVCEGTVTEPAYFRAVERLVRKVILEIAGAGVPKTVVQRAVADKKKAEREAESRENDFLRYDQVWCVFDVDDHPLLPEAKQQAQVHEIGIAQSNPCFELWLLLHFEDQTAHIKRSDLRKRCETHMHGYKKHPDCTSLMERMPAAITRATKLENSQADVNPGGNPSTGVHRLVQAIQEAASAVR
jgi:hypothetical protein